jgi:putative NADH-flavin reductase
MKAIIIGATGLAGDLILKEIDALGTTIRQAGSQKEQQRIDRDMPIAFS